MKTAMQIAAHLRAASKKVYLKATSFTRRHADALLLIFGVGLLTVGLAEISNAQVVIGGGQDFKTPGYVDQDVRGAVGLIFQLIEGAFGALVMVVAGLAAIIAAAMGAYRAALGMLVVAVGAFILRALVSLFFGTNFTAPTTAGGGVTL